MRKVLIQAAVLIALGACLGFASNAIRPDGLPWVYRQGQESSQIQPIDLAGAKRLFDEGKALFVDARPAREFAQGRVKGAVSVPEEEMEKTLPEFTAKVPLGRPLVVYCSGTECNASVILGGKLADAGYIEVRVFFGGWPEWQKAGYSIEGPWQ